MGLGWYGERLLGSSSYIGITRPACSYSYSYRLKSGHALSLALQYCDDSGNYDKAQKPIQFSAITSRFSRYC